MNQAHIWEEKVIIPTYGIGRPEKNPVFAEKRVYQGSSGKVYPYPVIEKILDEKKEQEYRAVFLENEYLQVIVLPELGGRIQRAYDKTNGYDFVYYNQVIKPALVGLTGPWISGGIEFNWPQHHRPTTFLPVDYELQQREDGSVTVLLNDVDLMYGTKGIASITLHPGKAYIEIKGQLYNRTPLPQTFLWWANPAVAVNDDTQSVFPPDVHAVMDHGKRDVSSFPIARGIYYKHDYSAGVDISRYKNIPVPTSYMAEKSDFDFVGGYDYGKEAGLLHVADHHISPGKKQWTWGCGDFGKAWDRNLTDEDGPYIELMTGVFTDNQPDFTWLMPFEEKAFTQYFMPYKKIGYVKNATIDAAVNLEIEAGKGMIRVYTTAEQDFARIVLRNGENILFEETVRISPEHVYEKEIAISCQKESELTVQVFDRTGRLLVAYSPSPEKEWEMPTPAQSAKEPKDIATCEELYLTGLHLEQYRHATYLPEDYYLEGLSRDPGDIRLNNAYGLLLLRRGFMVESEVYFRKALARMTWKNPNPYNGEAYYNLGLSLLLQDRRQEAYDAFFKATWSNEQQEMAFYYLAAIAAGNKDYEAALAFVEKAISKNTRNIKARGMKAVLLRKCNRLEEAANWIKENLSVDAFDYVSRMEAEEAGRTEGRSTGADSRCAGNVQEVESLDQLMRGYSHNYLLLAKDYAEGGFYEEAIKAIDRCHEPHPMLSYTKAYYLGKLGREEESLEVMKAAEGINPDCCFPTAVEDILVLEYACKINSSGAKAPYYLGNLYYDKHQYEKARDLWEASVKLDDTFPTVLRNLALVYFNKSHEPNRAKEVLEKAFALDTTDARVFMELDQLYKKLLYKPEDRLAFYEAHRDNYLERDDMYIEYVTLLNTLGRHEEAYELIMKRKFHPWEGGEGKASGQYSISLIQRALQLMEEKPDMAAELLNQALIYPENLGEGKLEGTKDNHIYYYLGLAMDRLGRKEEAVSYYEKATEGTEEPAGAMFYNDQPADMILFKGLAYRMLGDHAAAERRFQSLIEFAKEHMEDQVKIDYFAVSLPDLQIFEEDLNIRNQAHCFFLSGLGHLGMGDQKKAEEELNKALLLNPHLINARLYLKQQIWD